MLSGELKKVMKHFSNIKESLTGLDFLLVLKYPEVPGTKKLKDVCICCLCNTEGDSGNIKNHFTSNKHHMNYLNLNYKSIVIAMSKINKINRGKGFLTNICQEVTKRSIQKYPTIVRILNEKDKQKQVQSHFNNIIANQKEPSKKNLKKILKVLKDETNNVQIPENLPVVQQPVTKKRKRRGLRSKLATSSTDLKRFISPLNEIGQNGSETQGNQDQRPTQFNCPTFWRPNNEQNSVKLPIAHQEPEFTESTSTMTTHRRSRSPLNEMCQNQKYAEWNQDQMVVNLPTS